MPVKIIDAAHTSAEDAAAQRLFVKSYGCQMNVYDGLRLADLMRPHGYALVETPEDADLVVFNTCHIREKADEKLFSDVGRFSKAAKKDAVLAVGGCVGQAMGKKVMQRAPKVKVVFGPQTYHRLPEFLHKLNSGHKRVVDTDFPQLEKFDTLPRPGVYGPTAYVTIQEGCNKYCTYCVVPYTRGPEICRDFKAIRDEVKVMLEGGVKEVCLLGQNVNAYSGVDENGKTMTLATLIKRLLECNGLERLRFTTSHPFNMGDDLIDLFEEEPRVMPYLHLPVQAGSDKVLREMNRTHTAAEYIDIIDRVRDARPDIAISGDFITGFPGETEEDFLQTLKVVEEVQYASAYSFAYSPRPGTPAAALPQVEKEVKFERLSRLQNLLDEQQATFNKKFQGQTVEVLVEEKGKEKGQMRGRSPHNVVVNFDVPQKAADKFSGDNFEEALIGKIVRVTIAKAKPKSLLGTLNIV